MSPASLAACITNRTAAIVVVDLYGNVPDMAPIREIAGRQGIPIIEDAAEAVGGSYFGERAGALGDIGVFSFHGSKTLTTGEGGMLVTNSHDVFDRTLVLRDHGRLPGDTFFFNHEVGFKYKMISLQAPLVLAQLERVDELVAKKRLIFDWYRQELEKNNSLTMNWEMPGTRSTFWMVTAVVGPEQGLDKRELVARMSAREIDCRPFFHPLSSLPAYASSKEAAKARLRNHVSYAIGSRGINLPSGLNLTLEAVQRVCASLQEAMERPTVAPATT